MCTSIYIYIIYNVSLRYKCSMFLHDKIPVEPRGLERMARRVLFEFQYKEMTSKWGFPQMVVPLQCGAP